MKTDVKQQIPVLSVSQLTRAIKRQLEQTYPVVWIQGEISNSKLHSSGHFYFSLKDQEAQISGVMFRGAISQYKFVPKDGDKVVLRGEITVYPPQGRYQVIAHEMKPAGIGELLQKLEELKKLLRDKGWFDLDKKKAIPSMPKKIGIVTSPTGAAIQDMIHILTRRFAGVHVILNPVRVQGEGAALEIAQAINQFNQYQLVDVIIVGRGGGSIEDLWAFNELPVAEAIYKSEIPVISAVGHETDTTIADFVADLRAPTPSAAAEQVIGEKEQHIKYLNQIEDRLNQLLIYQIKASKQQLQAIIKQPFFTSPYGLLGPWMQHIDQLHKRLLLLKPTNQIKVFMQKLKQLELNIHYAWRSKLSHAIQILNAKSKRNRLNQLIARNLQLQKDLFKKIIATLQALDPKQVLKKGYAIPFSLKDGSVITSVQNVHKDDELKLLLTDGEIFSTIKEIKKR